MNSDSIANFVCGLKSLKQTVCCEEVQYSIQLKVED